MLNNTYGSLTVASEQILIKTGMRNRPYRLCICSCGTKKKFREDNLLSGKTTSCGCTKVSMSVAEYKKYKEKGLTDYEVAKKAKISTVTLHKWKKIHNIVGQFKRNYKERSKVSLSQEEYNRLKDKGMTDLEIADLKNIHLNTFLYWKTKNNIQQKERVRKSALCDFTIEEYDQFKNKGLQDNEIASRLYVSLATLNKWKQKNGLGNKYKRIQHKYRVS